MEQGNTSSRPIKMGFLNEDSNQNIIDRNKLVEDTINNLKKHKNDALREEINQAKNEIEKNKL